MESVPNRIRSSIDFDRAIELSGAEQIMPTLVKDYWDKPSDLTRAIQEARCLRVTKQSVSTVAIFFHALGVGGGEKVTRDLASIWLQMGLKVIVITNTEPTEDDYELPKGVERLTVPSFVGNMKENYSTRCTGLRDILLNHDVDAMVFAHWFSDVIAFDILSVKTLGIPFFLLIQTSFTQFFLDSDLPSRFVDIPLQYSLADGIICLSEMDQCFWSTFNRHTVCTQNPAPSTLPKEPAPCAGHTIIWPARIHCDKYPLRVIPIMEALVRKVPDAQLLMVGPVDPQLGNQMKEEAKAHGVSGSISLCGPQHERDMPSWYRKADVFLLTSKREGWPLALGEALSHGLPCVMYDLPYLTLAKDNPAVIRVEQDDAEAAADALATLLLDKEKAEALGNEGRAFMSRIAQYDYKEFWQACFASALNHGNNARKNQLESNATHDAAQTEAIMWNELLGSYRAHLAAFEDERHRSSVKQSQLELENVHLRENLNYTQKELEHVVSSKSFRIGIAITQTLKKLLGFFRKTSRV